MKNLTRIVQSGLITLAILIVGLVLASIYRTQVRNQAINDCYAQSYYRSEYQQDGKTITTSETQKWVYTQCLADKNIK